MQPSLYLNFKYNNSFKNMDIELELGNQYSVIWFLIFNKHEYIMFLDYLGWREEPCLESIYW